MRNWSVRLRGRCAGSALVVAGLLIAGAWIGCAGSHAAGARTSAPKQASPVVSQVASDLPAAVFTTATGDTVPIYVEIADNEQSQETGLMNRTVMQDDHGMAFLFTRAVTIPFWMKDTLIPLSIAFIDASGGVVDIQEMQAQSLDTHSPAAPYQFAIEANATWYARNGIHVGDTVDMSQVLAQSVIFGSGPTPSPSP